VDDLKAKTAQWKKLVKVQLADAEQKNEQLRRELKDAKDSATEASVAVRLELSAEFKDRLAMKDVAIASLEADLGGLRDIHASALAQQQEHHAADIKRAQQLHASELESQQKEAQHSLQRLRELHDSELEKERRRLDAALADAASAKEFAERLRRSDEGATDTELGIVRAEADDLRQQVAALQGRLSAEAQKNEQSVAELMESRDSHAAAEAARRDEQLAVTQSILRATQQDLQVAVNRVARQETVAQEQATVWRSKIATVTAELASQTQAAASACASEARVRRQVSDLQVTVDQLQREAVTREAAFHELFESDVNRAVYGQLGEIERAQSAVITLQSQVDELRADLCLARQLAADSDAAAKGREAELTRRLENVLTQEGALKARESALVEQRQALAKEAARVESHNPSGAARSASETFIIGPAPNATRDAALLALQRYRTYVPHTLGRFLPVLLLVLLLLLVLWWFAAAGPASGLGGGATGLKKVTETREELVQLQRGYASIKDRLDACLQKSSSTK
jgi:hypothetical protein